MLFAPPIINPRTMIEEEVWYVVIEEEVWYVGFLIEWKVPV